MLFPPYPSDSTRQHLLPCRQVYLFQQKIFSKLQNVFCPDSKMSCLLPHGAPSDSFRQHYLLFPLLTGVLFLFLLYTVHFRSSLIIFSGALFCKRVKETNIKELTEETSYLPFNYEKVKVCHGKVNTSDHWRPKVNDKFGSV